MRLLDVALLQYFRSTLRYHRCHLPLPLNMQHQAFEGDAVNERSLEMIFGHDVWISISIRHFKLVSSCEHALGSLPVQVRHDYAPMEAQIALSMSDGERSRISMIRKGSSGKSECNRWPLQIDWAGLSAPLAIGCIDLREDPRAPSVR